MRIAERGFRNGGRRDRDSDVQPKAVADSMEQ